MKIAQVKKTYKVPTTCNNNKSKKNKNHKFNRSEKKNCF